MQSNQREYMTLMNQSKVIMAQYGPRGFMRGMTATITGSFLTFSTYFAAYEFLKKELQTIKWIPKHVSPFIASLVGGVFPDILYIPFNLIRTHMQLGTFDYKNVLDGIYKIYKIEGIKNLYLGGGIFLMTSTFHYSISFGLYEIIKKMSQNHFPKEKGHISLS